MIVASRHAVGSRRMEEALGLDYRRPVPHAREWPTVLSGLLTQYRTQFRGELYRVEAQLQVPGARPPVLIAALGPAVLCLAGRGTAGTAIWMGGPAYLHDVAIPTITAPAAAAGRPAPRIAAGVRVCITLRYLILRPRRGRRRRRPSRRTAVGPSIGQRRIGPGAPRDRTLEASATLAQAERTAPVAAPVTSTAYKPG
jgi:hypothetical protein